MDIVRIGAEALARGGRHIGEIVGGGGCSADGIAVLLRLLERLARELTRDDVIRLVIPVHQIERNGGELRGRAALQKEHLIVVRNVHEAAEILLGGLDDGIVIGRSMTHLHH